jgi:hypothetical protein
MITMLDTAGQDVFNIGMVTLKPSNEASQVPNPVNFNFSKEMQLTGYSLDVRTAQAGESFGLNLYWRGLRIMSENYTVSVQLLGPENRNFAQKDSWPLDGALPTSVWKIGDLVRDRYELEIKPDTPPGVYDLQIVIYSVDDAGSIQRLQIVTEDGRLTDDFLVITQLRVLP